MLQLKLLYWHYSLLRKFSHFQPVTRALDRINTILYMRLLMKRLSFLILALALVISILPAQDAFAQSAPSIAKLAKESNVSPNILTKFRKGGLTDADLSNGLKLAKEANASTGMKMDEAAEKILNLRKEGKAWPDIASDLEVKLPKGIDDQ